MQSSSLNILYLTINMKYKNHLNMDFSCGARTNEEGAKCFVALTLATLLPLQPFEFETVSTIKEINYFCSAQWLNHRTTGWTVGWGGSEHSNFRPAMAFRSGYSAAFRELGLARVPLLLVFFFGPAAESRAPLNALQICYNKCVGAIRNVLLADIARVNQ